MELSTEMLLDTATVSITDVVCRAPCGHRSADECARGTHLVFPYRGVFVRQVLHKDDAVGDANQVVLFNAGEDYRIRHPVEGGDACLSLAIAEPLLRELVPRDQAANGETFAFRGQRLRIDPGAQALVALLKRSLKGGVMETLEAESLALTLVRRVVGESTPRAAPTGARVQKLVDRTKLVLSSDLGRRWTLAQIAAEVGVSPVYLTQVFRQVEAVPLYQYQLRLRLARALDLVGAADDLSRLGMDLGFSSHSHFSHTFRRFYGRTPAEFRRVARAS